MVPISQEIADAEVAIAAPSKNLSLFSIRRAALTPSEPGYALLGNATRTPKVAQTAIGKGESS